jgi:16S rRNA (guanine527-N7)-methyltransferase
MISKAQERELKKLMNIFLEENTKLNLSAFRTKESCWIGNILDSISLLEIFQSLQFPSDKITIVDIGTGGGFPLLPLAICLPDNHFVGIDSTRKKVDAVSHIVQKMHISNVELQWTRAQQHLYTYDFVLARAVAPLKKLLPLAIPLAKPGGKLAFWKSINITDEYKESLNIQKRLRCQPDQTYRYKLPGDFGERQIIFFNVDDVAST